MPSSNHPSENEIVIVLQHLQQSEDLNHVSNGVKVVRNLWPPRSWVPGHALRTCQTSAKSPVCKSSVLPLARAFFDANQCHRYVGQTGQIHGLWNVSGWNLRKVGHRSDLMIRMFHNH